MSIKQQMQDKAAAMIESMAERARTPQDIEALRQRILAQVQAGTLQPYVGIPLLQDLGKKLSETRAQAAQMVAGMNMPPAQGGAPIAQQVLAEAQGAGVQALPSGLPESYAPGGLVAFADGGEVERYAEGGTPASRWWSGVKQSFSDMREEMELRNRLAMKYGPAGALPGLFMNQTDAERAGAQQADEILGRLNLPQLKMLESQGPSALPQLMAQLNTPAAGTSTAGAGRGSVNPPLVNPSAPMPGADAAPAARPAGIAGIGAPAFKMPTLPAEPTLADLSGIVTKAGTDAKTAAATASAARRKELDDLDSPLEQAREERLSKRQAAAEKDSAVGRALNLMSLGFGIAGSKERTLAGALGNEGRQGIAELIRGEAANRAAMEKLEDARDAFEQQKSATRKGNMAAADAAGQRAADDIRQYATLNVQAAGMGNSQALQRYQTQQQGALGLAGLDLQRRGQDIQAAGVNAQLQLGREKLQLLQGQIQAGNTRAAAALAGAQQKAYAAFQSDPNTRALIAGLQKKYGANYMTNPQAQMELQQAQRMYMMNALPALLGSEGTGSNIKDVAELLKD